MENPIAQLMPAAYAHRGVWTGTYRHLDAEARMIDCHQARVEVIFPEAGAVHYIQRNHFMWADGRSARAELPGVFRDGRIHWDTERFSGFAWESNGVVLLELDRKDEPGVQFTEVIILAPGGNTRTRTWHWFKGGRLIRRTLCDEERVL